MNEECLERACTHPLHQSDRESGRERESEKEGGGRERCRIWFLNLSTMAALQIKCFSSSLTRNKFFNCPELLFLKGMTGALAPFSCLDGQDITFY
jgi:hypothetical protein